MVRFANYELRRAMLFSVAISVITLFNTTSAGAQVSEKTKGLFGHKYEGVPLAGYLGDPKVSEMALEILVRYLASNSDKDGTKRASLLSTFIHHEIVSNGRFVNPSGVDLPEATIELLAPHKFLDEECNVLRMYSETKEEAGEYLVFLVYGGETEDVKDIESCLLLAAAVAAGVYSDDFPDAQNSDKRLFLDAAILGN
ncbi:hypothetical protein [uncultured Ruegeria sp.]|uniref:hypothetical protein n=1 Tax=uncultured Ruegeria sp. TaxID=259304 RepID=UPI0026097635|nr:hypothetical protein [uncultured Ruegeria sp.]